MSWADETTALAYDIVTDTGNMTPAAANLILSNPKANNRGFLESAVRVFKAGVRNDMKVAETLDYDVISPDEARALFDEGQKAAEAQVEARDAEVKAKQKTATEDGSAAERKGGVFYEYDGKTIKQRNDGKHKPLTKKQRVSVNFTERLAKKFGSTVFFYESYEENGKRMYKDRDGNIREAKEGFYDPSDGSIHIDLNGDNVLFTVSHELVHFIKDWSPVQFKKMADLVMKGFNRQGLTAEELIEAKQADYAADGITLTEEQAFEEVIAASLEGIMADGRVMELLQAAEAKDKGLGAKLRQFFQDVKDLIRDTIDSYKDAIPGSPEGRLIRKMEDIYSQLQEVFAESIVDAGTNFQNAENTTGEGGVRYSLVEPFIDNNGIKYDNAVLLDTQFFDGLSPRNWGTKLRNFVKFRSLTDRFVLPIYDENGVVQQLEFAKIRDRVSKNNGDDHPVLGELSSGKDNFSKLAVIHIDEIVDISNDDIPYYTPQKQTEKHGWMDQNGWLHRYSYVIDARKGTIYRLTFDIAKADDGRHILYATKGKIKKVGNANVNSLKIRGSKLNSGFVPSLAQYDPTVKRKDLEYLFAVDQKDMKTAQRMVDEAAKASGYTIKAYHGTTNLEEHSTWNADRREWDTTYSPITVFKRQYDGQAGHFFSADRDNAGGYGSYLYSVFLMIKKPLVIECNGQFYSSISFDGKTMDTYEWADYARKHRYDGVIFKNVRDGVDYGAISEPVTEYVVFDSNRIKSADPITYDKDGNVIPLSERFNPTKRDIRYSIGQKTDGAVQKLLERENDALREDVARLKELLKLQGTETHGTRFTPSSVEAAARYLKKNAGAKGDTKALARLLNGFYEHIAKTKELTWEDVREQAKPIANWMMDHVEHNRSDYAQEVLDQIHGSRVHLDETQLAEAAYRFESYDAFRRSMAGAITISRNADMSLDVWWQEMSTLYPDIFSADTTASDMPGELFNIVNRLRNENSSALEYEYNRRWIQQDLIRDIYDSYWRVNNLRTVADRNAAQINRLKSLHAQRMNKMKADNRQQIEQLKEQHKAEVKAYRDAYRKNMETQRKEMVEKYRQSRLSKVSVFHKKHLLLAIV